jgi:hypothetical protein
MKNILLNHLGQVVIKFLVNVTEMISFCFSTSTNLYLPPSLFICSPQRTNLSPIVLEVKADSPLALS